MKRFFPLAAGIAMILGAFFLATLSQSQDDAARPEIAQRFATAFHLNQSPAQFATPTFAPTPTPADPVVSGPTPIRLANPEPGRMDVVQALFADSLSYMTIDETNPQVTIQRLRRNATHPVLVVSGEGPPISPSAHLYPFAFAAVLVWDNTGYVVRFKHVEYAAYQEPVAVTLSGYNRISFLFQQTRFTLDEQGRALQRGFILYPCTVNLKMAQMQALAKMQGTFELNCF